MTAWTEKGRRQMQINPIMKVDCPPRAAHPVHDADTLSEAGRGAAGLPAPADRQTDRQTDRPDRTYKSGSGRCAEYQLMLAVINRHRPTERLFERVESGDGQRRRLLSTTEVRFFHSKLISH